ncbi:hypothetical protein [Streptomyces sp.]|uniref:hypothetical protein n=1 Tax=Streptomyces sp. TaxID=1931 RepID=UPI0028128268|nr:hypothetical protein [Streptomyces sp.]
MTGEDPGPALLGVTVVLALLVIRTGARELRTPGSARQEWTFLRDRRGLLTFLVTTSVLSAVTWTVSGPAHLPWAALAALLATRVLSGR